LLEPKKYKKKDGSYFLFKENAVALINKQGNPVGTRILGPLPKSIKKKKFMKFVSLSIGFNLIHN
jgi:large subunit ribosomal protein L14